MQELKAFRVLILCPASLRLNWAREVETWTAGTRKTCVLKTGGDHIIDANEMVVITSYALASRNPLLQMLAAREWDLLVLDESHQCKNVTSQVSRACLVTLWAKARYRLALTGTPVPNGRAVEAWPLFSRLCPEKFGAWKPYASRYCIPEETPWGLTYPRSKNLEELSTIARERFMVRRTRETVLGELPPLMRSVVPLDVPLLRIREAEEGIDLDALLKAMESGIPLRSDHISTARRKLGILKAPVAIDYLKDLLEEIHSVVVFCHHKEVFFALKDGLREGNLEVVSISGATSAEERQKAVDTFQSGYANVFLGSISAASTGITLTASSVVVFVEADWVPSTNEQAEGRVRRIGQKESMRAIYLVVPGSLDEAVQRAVIRKQKNIEKIVGAA